MQSKIFGAAGVLLLVAAVACTQAGAPLAPSSTTGGLDAAADGSTLKATAPEPVSPVGGIRIDSTAPLLIAKQSTAQFIASTPLFNYSFEILRADNNQRAGGTNAPIGPGLNGQTAFQSGNLELDTRYKWRARAELDGRVGPWSAFSEFLTIDYRGIVPRPPNGDWPSNGPAVVNYIAASFPSRLRVTSLSNRIANMRYLRDRIIEAGICGGLDVAHNKKRGYQEHSVDALAWRMPNGKFEVIDLASAYDDPTQTLRLKWAITTGQHGYDPYPNESQKEHPGC